MTKKLQYLIAALILIISGSYSKSQSLRIEIPIVKNGASVTDTLDNGQIVTYDVSSDDAEQENDAMDKLYDDDIDVGWEGAPEDQNVLSFGLRFQNINLPKSARIDSAFIQFYCHEGKSADDEAIITIAGEASGAAETYNLDNLITDRPRTQAQVKWTVAEDWETWAVYRTPDIKNIIQEIIGISGWQTGNPIAIMLLGEDQGPSDYENAREFESFENISDPEEGGDGQNHPERVPRLFVYFSVQSDVNETREYSEFSVYPNPNESGYITVNGEKLPGSLIAVYNQMGQIIFEQKSENGSVRIDINEQPAGIYYIKIYNGKDTSVEKLIKY